MQSRESAGPTVADLIDNEARFQVTNAFPNQGPVIQDALVRSKSLS